MQALLRDLLPHAPQMGLYLAPDIPPDKLRGALRDYATSVHKDDVLALYDATLMGSAKDGAVFTAREVVFQNNDLQEPQTVRYADLVRVEEKRKLLGGKKVRLSVNRGRSTFDVEMDFSGKAGAAAPVARFLHEALLSGAADEMDAGVETDRAAVRAALDRLREAGKLADADHARLLDALRR